MRGRATRLLALDTYFLLDNDDDEGDGEDHSGVSDDGVEGEGRGERGKGGEEGKTKEMLKRDRGKKGGEGEGRNERSVLSSFLSKGTVFFSNLTVLSGIPCTPCHNVTSCYMCCSLPSGPSMLERTV